MIATSYLPLVHSCEIVHCVPWGTHEGTRVTFYATPSAVRVQTLRRPKPFHEAAAVFQITGEVLRDIVIPSWEYAKARLSEVSRHQVDGIRNSRVDEYVESVGISESSLQASYDLTRSPWR